jgi:hypothetical protein
MRIVVPARNVIAGLGPAESAKRRHEPEMVEEPARPFEVVPDLMPLRFAAPNEPLVAVTEDGCGDYTVSGRRPCRAR